MADTPAPAGDGELQCTFNPDIAGLGIVLAFTFTAGLALSISVACGILKLLDPDESVHGDKHEDPSLQASSTGDTLVSGLSLQHKIVLNLDARLKNLRETANADGREFKLQRWHGVLSTMLLGLSVNQIVASVAISISALVVFRSSLADPNVDLANDLSLLSVTSQLAVSTVLYRPTKWSVHYRSASFYAYVCLLVASTIVQQVNKRHHDDHGSGQQEGQHALGGRTTNWIILVVVVSYGVWASLLVNLADSSRGRKILAELSKGSSKVAAFLVHWSWVQSTKHSIAEWKKSHPSLTKVTAQASKLGLGRISWYHLMLDTPWFRTCMGFIVSSALTAVALASAVIAKLRVDSSCEREAEGSQWTFGNILALGMIAALLVPGLDAWFESRERAKHRYVDQGTQTDDDDDEMIESALNTSQAGAQQMATDVRARDDPGAVVKSTVPTVQPDAVSDGDDGYVAGARMPRRDTLELEAQHKRPMGVEVRNL